MPSPSDDFPCCCCCLFDPRPYSRDFQGRGTIWSVSRWRRETIATSLRSCALTRRPSLAKWTSRAWKSSVRLKTWLPESFITVCSPVRTYASFQLVIILMEQWVHSGKLLLSWGIQLSIFFIQEHENIWIWNLQWHRPVSIHMVATLKNNTIYHPYLWIYYLRFFLKWPSY